MDIENALHSELPPEKPDPPEYREWARYWLRRAKQAGDRDFARRMQRYLKTGMLEGS